MSKVIINNFCLIAFFWFQFKKKSYVNFVSTLSRKSNYNFALSLFRLNNDILKLTTTDKYFNTSPQKALTSQKKLAYLRQTNMWKSFCPNIRKHKAVGRYFNVILSELICSGISDLLCRYVWRSISKLFH